MHGEYKMEKAHVKLATLGAFVLILIPFLWRSESSLAQRPKPATAPQQKATVPLQQQPKDLQVLKGMSQPEVMAVMRSWSAALNVECAYCHTNSYEADSPRKEVARLMQRDYVSGLKHTDGSALSCQYCHQGQANFLRTRPFEGMLGTPQPEIRVLTDMNREQIMQVMNGFTKALAVNCTYCHTESFTTETPRKQITRFMMTEFTQGLTKRDGSTVSCADCHKGHGRLLSVLPLPQRAERHPSGSKEPAPKKSKP